MSKLREARNNILSMQSNKTTKSSSHEIGRAHV